MTSKMKKLFVPFKLAELVKMAGFDEPCFAYWDTAKGTNVILFKARAWEKRTNSKANVITAPTYQQIIDWFREKHSLEIKLSAFDTENKIKWHFSLQPLVLVEESTFNTLVIKFKTPKYNVSDTYRQALNSGIEEALTLI